MQTGLIFLAVLSVLVLIHELGHFLAARWLGIKVEEFAFGLPFTRPIFKIKRGETDYSVYPLLFGGFVRLYGEETEPGSEKNRAFWTRGRRQRMAVVAAGVVMNVALAVAGFVILYTLVGVPMGKQSKVTVVEVEEASPAAEAGIRVDDRITEVEGKRVAEGAEFSGLMRSWAGLEVNLTVERGGEGVALLEGITEGDVEKLNVKVTPRLNPPEGQGPVGVGIADFPYITSAQCSFFGIQCIGGFVAAGVKTTGLWMGRVVEGLRSIGQSLVRGKAPEGVAGPIGIYQLTDVVARGGFLPVLELTAVLSVNLAVFNVLPIPALDGGRMFFIWVEWLRKKRISAGVEQKINSWGMAALLVLMAAITLQDVVRTGVIERIFGK